GSFVEVGQAAADATSYVDGGLAASANYVYRLRATNAGGDSAYTTEASGTTITGPPPPAAPSSLAVGSPTSSSLTLSWADNASNETGFEVERRLTSDPPSSYAQVGTVGANVTTYADTGLASSTDYTYRLRATNAG